MRPAILLLACAATFAAACGGAAPQPQTPTPALEAPAEEKGKEDSDEAPPPPAAEATPSTAPPVSSLKSNEVQQAMDEVNRWVAIAQGERAEAASRKNACQEACRALASMERAVQHLCAMQQSFDDPAPCALAHQRLADARLRVLSVCERCEGK